MKIQVPADTVYLSDRYSISNPPMRSSTISESRRGQKFRAGFSIPLIKTNSHDQT